VTRKGDPINPGNLMKASAPRARAIVILSEGKDADEADAQAARCCLAISGGMGKWLEGHIVVELRDKDNAPVVRMGITGDYPDWERNRMVMPMCGADLIGRLMIQCSLEAGLAHVFAHIMEFAGNEFYFSGGKEWMAGLYGQTFARIAFLFADAVVLGIKYGDASRAPVSDQGTLLISLNPPGTDILEEGDELLVIAEDDDTYWPGPDMCTKVGIGPDIEAPPEPPTKTLLVGWRRDIQDMVIELDKWVEPGSQLVMLNHSVTREDAISEMEANNCDIEMLANLKVNFETCQPIFRRELERCNIPDYDSILVLTEELGSDGLSSDSRSMITLLLCRDLQNAAVRDSNAVTWGRKIPSNQAVCAAEILDPRTAEVLKLAKTNDHVVSNQLISMALAQMAEENDQHELINQLFSEEGNELHIKDCSLYAFEGEELCFWDILNRARQRAEVALGYQRKEDLLAGKKEKGLVLNPLDKTERFVWRTGDKIVVLAED